MTKPVAFAAAFAFVGFLALSYSPDAWAQVTESTTANDVICSQCVHTSDIKKGAISTNRIKKNAVKTAKIADGAVNSAKILDGSVTGADIANSSITGADIATGSVFGSDIADSSLTGNDIANGSVTGIDIQDGSLTGADIANSSITGTDIATGSVYGSDIADGTITYFDLGTNSVYAAEIGASAVGQSEIATNGVASSEVSNSSLYDVDLADEAGMDFSFANESERVYYVDEIIRSVYLTAPTSGYVVIMASGTWDRYYSGTGRCSITTGTAITAYVVEATLSSIDKVPFSVLWSGTKSAGTTRYNLVCDFNSASIAYWSYIKDAEMAVMFFPTRY